MIKELAVESQQKCFEWSIRMEGDYFEGDGGQ
jgi:hypothetical protein